MPKLNNNLRPFALEVLRDHLSYLSDPKAVFTLQVGDGFSERVLYWFNGRLFLLSNGERSGPGVAGHLLQRGKLDTVTYHTILETCRKEKITLQDMLLKRQVLTVDEFEELSRRLMRDEIYDLVFWEDCLYSSSSAPPPSDFFRPDGSLLSSEVNHEQLTADVIGWIKTWMLHKSVLHGDTSRLELKEPGAKALEGEPGAVQTILKGCQGGTTLRLLWRTVEVDLPDLCDRIVKLIERGYISVTQEARSRSNRTLEQSIELLEKILPQSVGKDLVRSKLVSLYRRAKQPDKACHYLQLIAYECLGRSDWETAGESLRSLLAIRPEDTQALRQLVKLYMKQSGEKQATTFVLQVAQNLLKQGKTAELKSVADMLGHIPGAGLAAQEIRADLSLLEGDRERAVKDYQALASRYEEADDLDRAVQVLGKALECDKDNESLKNRLVKLKKASTEPRGNGKPGFLRRLRIPLSVGRGSAVSPSIAAALVLSLVLMVLYLAKLPPFGDTAAAAARDPRSDASRAAGLGSAAAKQGPKAVVVVPQGGSAGGVRVVEGSDDPASGAAGGAPSRTTPSGGRSGASGPSSVAAQQGTGPSPSGGGAGTSGVSGDVRAGDSPAPIDPQSVASALGPSATMAAPTERSPDADASGSAPASDAAVSSAQEPGTPGSAPVPLAGKPASTRLFREIAPPKDCPLHGNHKVLTFRLGPARRVQFADSCRLRLEDMKTGAALEYPGGEKTRWAFDSRGDVVCAWQPGKEATLYRSFTQEVPVKTSWSVPAGTEALAVAGEMIALRQGKTTRLFKVGEGELRSAQLPAWNEGILDGSTLFIARHGAGGDSKQVWAVDVETLGMVELTETEGEE